MLNIIVLWINRLIWLRPLRWFMRVVKNFSRGANIWKWPEGRGLQRIFVLKSATQIIWIAPKMLKVVTAGGKGGEGGEPISKFEFQNPFNLMLNWIATDCFFNSYLERRRGPNSKCQTEDKSHTSPPLPTPSRMFDNVALVSWMSRQHALTKGHNC